MRIPKLLSSFFASEQAAGIVLIFCTLVSLIITNISWGLTYLHFWELNIAQHSLVHWINDALMTLFFLLMGLELKREMYLGELANIKSALSPLVAALGGMLVPACVYFLCNRNTVTVRGAGIPMATDIAFALGVLSLLGKRVPVALKVFLTALAVIDDLGAILVIAIFYTASINWHMLLFSLSIFGLLLLLRRWGVHHLLFYLLGGILMWYCMDHSGVHATISGVLLAFALPFGKGKHEAASYKVQQYLHWPVAYFILPLFALANTAIVIPADWQQGLLHHQSSLGIALGLLVGKPLGIVCCTGLAVRMGYCQLPKGLTWSHLWGLGLLAGIGFTMSIFISLLAFDQVSDIITAKIAILCSSTIAAIIGLLFLWRLSTRFEKCNYLSNAFLMD
jgi:NhaA family Na+:H+ antiporter